VSASGPPPQDRSPVLRASDGERERVVTALRDGAAEGRLTFDELAQRVEQAYGATTAGELDLLLADLPAVAPATTPGLPKRRRWNVAVMGGSTRRGRWRPAPRSVALALMGGVDLDLREATIEGDELVITAIAVMGGIDLRVPEGVEVDLGGFAFMGGNDHLPGEAPVRPGTPIVRVRAFSLMGGVDVKVGRSRRERRAGIS
jgi:hypothetical protein